MSSLFSFCFFFFFIALINILQVTIIIQKTINNKTNYHYFQGLASLVGLMGFLEEEREEREALDVDDTFEVVDLAVVLEAELVTLPAVLALSESREYE